MSLLTDIQVGGGGLKYFESADASGTGRGGLLKNIVGAGCYGVTQNICGVFESDSLVVQILVYRGA